jgi:hypothetical protein
MFHTGVGAAQTTLRGTIPFMLVISKNGSEHRVQARLTLSAVLWTTSLSHVKQQFSDPTNVEPLDLD